MASLGLVILQNLEIQQNWNSTKAGNSTKLEFYKNWKFNKMELHHMASLGLVILQKLKIQQN